MIVGQVLVLTCLTGATALLSSRIQLTLPDSQRIREYCDDEAFEASCPSGEVIVITRALFGRMRTGRCVKVNKGIGCYHDAINFLDSRCSGLQTCTVSIQDSELRAGDGNCPEEMYRYLEASYRCVPVARHSSRICSSASSLQEPSAFISNNHTSLTCQWRIRLQTGQRINVTLYDFGVAVDPGSSSCQKYADIRDNLSGRTLTVCSGTERVRSVFLSESHELDVETYGIGNMEADASARSLLRYEAIGCPNPQIPDNAWMKRTGDSATLRCNSTQQTSVLICEGGAWVGQVHLCPSLHEHDSSPRGWWQILSTTQGVTVIVFVGIFLGIFIGGCLLGAVFWHYKRKDRQRMSRMEECEYDAAFHDDNHVHLGDNALDYQYRTEVGHHELMHQGKQPVFLWKGNQYSEDERCSCEPVKHTPPGDHKTPEGVHTTPRTTASLASFGKHSKSGPDHMYETPK